MPSRPHLGRPRTSPRIRTSTCVSLPPGTLSRILPPGAQPGPIYRHHAAPDGLTGGQMTETTARPQLSDRYTATSGRVQLTGVQALARLPIDQHRRDLAAGL